MFFEKDRQRQEQHALDEAAHADNAADLAVGDIPPAVLQQMAEIKKQIMTCSKSACSIVLLTLKWYLHHLHQNPINQPFGHKTQFGRTVQQEKFDKLLKNKSNYKLLF